MQDSAAVRPPRGGELGHDVTHQCGSARAVAGDPGDDVLFKVDQERSFAVDGH